MLRQRVKRRADGERLLEARQMLPVDRLDLRDWQPRGRPRQAVDASRRVSWASHGRSAPSSRSVSSRS